MRDWALVLRPSRAACVLRVSVTPGAASQLSPCAEHLEVPGRLRGRRPRPLGSRPGGAGRAAHGAACRVPEV